MRVQSTEAILESPAQRLLVVESLAAGVAHETNNLFTIVSGRIELALAETGEHNGHVQHLKKAREAISQLCALSNNLLNFAGAKTGERKPVDISAVTRQVLELVDYQLEKNDIRLTSDLDGSSGLVRGSEGELSQALLNLIINARQSMPDGGALHVSTRRNGKWVEVAVTDTGCGIPRDAMERVFDRFFTTREQEGGSGLGLSFCKDTVERHGGQLNLESEVGKGTAVTMRIPLLREGEPGVTEQEEPGDGIEYSRGM